MAEELDGPRYSEKQAGAILRRAVERSAAAGAEGSAGISLAEMERIAAELGIDPQHVRSAAAEVSGRSTPGLVDLEEIVPAELSEEAWDLILLELRRVFRAAGAATAIGRAREWDTPNVHVSLVSRDGGTKVHLMENHSSDLSVGWVMWGFFSLFILFLAVLIGAKKGGPDQALINALVTVGLSGAAFLGIRASVQSWRQRQQERMQGLLRRVTGLIREHGPSAAEPIPEVEAPERPVAKPVAMEAPQEVVARNS
ncbi:MAG: hypothetical protein ACO1SX_11785 [Actinomycetota bacterium]